MDTTLEEVFLKVSEEDQSLENSEAGGSPAPPHLTLDPQLSAHSSLVSGDQGFWVGTRCPGSLPGWLWG